MNCIFIFKFQTLCFFLFQAQIFLTTSLNIKFILHYLLVYMAYYFNLVREISIRYIYLPYLQIKNMLSKEKPCGTVQKTAISFKHSFIFYLFLSIILIRKCIEAVSNRTAQHSVNLAAQQSIVFRSTLNRLVAIIVIVRCLGEIKYNIYINK